MSDRPFANSSVYIGVITSRSVEVPSDPSLIFYNIEVHTENGVVPFSGIAPKDNIRWSSVFDIDLVPFVVGQRVPVGITRFGASEEVEIMQSELPSAGDCP